MKKIKLKNYWLSMFVLFLPTLLFSAVGVGLILLSEKYGAWLTYAGVGVLVVVCAVLIAVFPVLLDIESALKEVQNRLNAPVRYDYSGNGTTAQEIEQAIVSRCRKKLKREVKWVNTKNVPVFIGGNHSFSYSRYYSSVERGAIVYKTAHLTVELYHNIMNDAMPQHRAIHAKYWNKTKKDSAYGIVTPIFSTAVIIIADSIDPKVSEVVLKKKKAEKGYVLPCVIDVSNQSYCFDCEEDIPIFDEVMSHKNINISLMKKLIFGGRAPKPDEKYLKSFDGMEYNPETPLFEYVSAMVKEELNTLKNMKKNKENAEKELLEIAEKLSDGQTEIIENVCFCKIGENVGMSLLYAEDEDEPKNVDVYFFEEWEYPKSKKISKEDLSALRRLTEATLKKEGYEYKIVND
ncbi:MAG: hypothetical protein IJL87_02965 [Clostridia bacterium]|nr:hypothetical protein [Clostridia bacterium]